MTSEVGEVGAAPIGTVGGVATSPAGPASTSVTGRADTGRADMGRAGTAAVMALRDRVQRLHEAVDAVRVESGGGASPAIAVAVRDASARLGALLASLGSVLDDGASVEIRRSLAALADRGAEVVEADGARARAEQLLGAVARALVVGPVGDRLRHHQRARARTAAEALESAVDDPQVAAMLHDVDRLVITPPLTDAAGGKAAKVLGRCAAADDDRLDEALASVRGAPELPVTGDAWLSVRAAALALSGSAGVAATEHGKRARKLASAADEVVAAVDEVVEAGRLQRLMVDLADVAHRHREPGFTYGVLHAHAAGRSEAARARLDVAVDELGREKLRSWMPGR